MSSGSSGDMTTYIRGKREERGTTNEVFMMDGFDRWAESDAPNRVGGMYKDPAERGDRHRSSRKLDMFDSDSDSSCSSPSRRRSRRRGGARNYSDSSDSSDYSSDSSDSDSDYEYRGGGLGLGHGGDMFETAVEMGNNTKKLMESGKKMTDFGDVEEPNWANLVDYLIKVKGMSPAEARDHVKEMKGGIGLGNNGGIGLGRRRRRRSSRDSGCSSSSGSDGDESASEGEYLSRRAGGALPNVVQYADKAQDGYNLVKGYLPKGATEFIDKVFNLYNVIKTNASMFKGILGSTFPAGSTNASSAGKIKEKLEQLGFGRMPRRQTLKVMKGLDRKHGTKAAKLLKKMFGAGFLTDAAGQLAYDNAPFGKDTAKSLARSAVDKIIASSATAKKIDGFVDAGKEMYDNVKANMPLIRGAFELAKEKFPSKASSIDKVDNGLKAVGLGRKGKRQPSERNMMVSKLMREKGLSLGEASKQVSAMMKGRGDKL